MKRLISLVVTALMLAGTLSVMVSSGNLTVNAIIAGSSGIELPAVPIEPVSPDTPLDPEEEGTYYYVEAHGGTVSVRNGSSSGGKYKEGSVVTVSLNADAFAGKTFDHWTSAFGERISVMEFSLLVDKDAYFFPVFKDIKPEFGEWELYRASGTCEKPDVWMRTDTATGLVEYTLSLFNNGEHIFGQGEYVDEDHCKMTCTHCGFETVNEHYWSEEFVMREATHTVSGLKGRACSYCGTTVETDIGTTEEHTWGPWTVVTESVNGQPGVRRRTCVECGEYEDCWYIRADWEKYYGVNTRITFTADYNNQWGSKKEGHYHFINDDGNDTYVYGASWADKNAERVVQFMWIDEADPLGRKAIYHAKRMTSGWGYHWALIAYADTFEQYIGYIDSLYGDQSNVSHASALFDMFKKYEESYNSLCLPASGSPDFISSQSYWTDAGEAVISRGRTYDNDLGIPVRVYTNSSHQTMYVDPATGVCLDYTDSSSRMYYYINSMTELVPDEEYDSLTPEEQAEVIKYSELDSGRVIMYDTQNTTRSISEDHFSKPDPKNFRVIILSNINAGTIPDHFTDTGAFDNNYPGSYIESYHATSDLAGGGYYDHGYHIHDFGIAGTFQPGTYDDPALRNWYSNQNYALDLKAPYVDGWEFDHWERYNWSTGEWELFTEVNGEGNPCLNYTAVNADKTAFTVDNRLNDIAILKACYNESVPETVHVKVTGGTMQRIVGNNTYYLSSEEDVPVDSYICPVDDYDSVPEGKRFDHWRVFVGGVEISDPVFENISYHECFCVTDDTEFRAVYADEVYWLDIYAQNGTVYLDGEAFGGSEFTAGTELIFTTEGDDGYPYFKGWFSGGKGMPGGKPMSPEETGDRLIGSDTTLVYTTVADYQMIYAVWSDGEDESYNYHDVTVVNGFGSTWSMLAQSEGLKLSAFRIPDYMYFDVIGDPTVGFEIEKFTMTGVMPNGDPYTETQDYSGDYVSFDSGDSDTRPHALLVTGTGDVHVHDMISHAAVEATCTEPGSLLYYECSECGKFFSDNNGIEEIEESSWVIEALGHDWDEVQYEWDGNWSSVTASRTCKRDPAHTESERVQTSILTLSANDAETGVDIYTAIFTNTAFPPVSRTKTLAVVGTYVPGDVDTDLGVDMDDVVTMLRFIILPGVYSIDGYGGSLDFNCDQALNLYDVIRLLQYYLFPDLYPIS